MKNKCVDNSNTTVCKNELLTIKPIISRMRLHSVVMEAAIFWDKAQ
jgi:hypothetical protein